MFLPSGGKSSEEVARKRGIASVGKWVNECLPWYDPAYHVGKYEVMATEINCTDPGCVPIETLVVIVLMEQLLQEVADRPTRWADKILKPILEVTVEDVQEFVRAQFQPEISDASAERETTENMSSLDMKPPAVQVEQVQITRVVMKPNAPVKSYAAFPSSSSSGSGSSSFSSASILASTAGPKTTPMPTPPEITKTEQQHRKPEALLPTTAPIQPTVVNTSFPTEGQSTSTRNKKAPAPKKPARMMPQLSGAPAAATMASRHEKGSTRPRGCPCCDPDNLDNIVDSLLFLHYPQT